MSMSLPHSPENLSPENLQNPCVLEWCAPLVYDCLSEYYYDLLPKAHGARDLMTERHFVLWSALVRDDFSHLRADVHLLATQARALQIDFQICRAVDHYVGAEILDMSQRRYRRMPHEAHDATAALLNLLRRLERERSGDATSASLARAA